MATLLTPVTASLTASTTPPVVEEPLSPGELSIGAMLACAPLFFICQVVESWQVIFLAFGEPNACQNFTTWLEKNKKIR